MPSAASRQTYCSPPFQIQSFQTPVVPNDAPVPGSGGGAGKGREMLSGFLANARSQATGLLAAAADKVGLTKTDDNYVTRVVNNLCEFKPGSEDETFLYLDPKVKGDGSGAAPGQGAKGRVPFREVLVFMIGGGSYMEYQKIQSTFVDSGQQVTYGCTELMTAEAFLKQLGKLGS